MLERNVGLQKDSREAKGLDCKGEENIAIMGFVDSRLY